MDVQNMTSEYFLNLFFTELGLSYCTVSNMVQKCLRGI